MRKYIRQEKEEERHGSCVRLVWEVLCQEVGNEALPWAYYEIPFLNELEAALPEIDSQLCSGSFPSTNCRVEGLDL